MIKTELLLKKKNKRIVLYRISHPSQQIRVILQVIKLLWKMKKIIPRFSNNRGGKSINEKKNKASINTVLTSTTKFDINSKINFVFFIKLRFSCKTIQIVRVPGNNFKNSDNIFRTYV